MERKNKLILISVLAIFLMLEVIYMQHPLNKEVIPARFIAGERMGFDLGPGNLNFGKIVPGYSAERTINITNKYNSPTITKITSSGEISPYIIVSQNNFQLQPGETKTISFTALPDKEIELKEYSGKIIITTRKIN